MSYSGLVMHGDTVRDHVEQAQEGERHGFSGGWVTEVNEPDAITVLAAAAANTERFGLGTGIVPIGLRDPYLAAMSFWSLQDLSGGRVTAGFGVSTPVIVSNWHGLPWDRPVARMREYVDVFRRLTSGERLRHEGLYQTRAPAMEAAEPAIPVYIGALGEKMLELAGRDRGRGDPELPHDDGDRAVGDGDRAGDRESGAEAGGGAHRGVPADGDR